MGFPIKKEEALRVCRLRVGDVLNLTSGVGIQRVYGVDCKGCMFGICRRHDCTLLDALETEFICRDNGRDTIFTLQIPNERVTPDKMADIQKSAKQGATVDQIQGMLKVRVLTSEELLWLKRNLRQASNAASQIEVVPTEVDNVLRINLTKTSKSDLMKFSQMLRMLALGSKADSTDEHTIDSDQVAFDPKTHFIVSKRAWSKSIDAVTDEIEAQTKLVNKKIDATDIGSIAQEHTLNK